MDQGFGGTQPQIMGIQYGWLGPGSDRPKMAAFATVYQR